jgi:hypothetical protein
MNPSPFKEKKFHKLLLSKVCSMKKLLSWKDNCNKLDRTTMLIGLKWRTNTQVRLLKSKTTTNFREKNKMPGILNKRKNRRRNINKWLKNTKEKSMNKVKIINRRYKGWKVSLETK